MRSIITCVFLPLIFCAALTCSAVQYKTDTYGSLKLNAAQFGKFTEHMNCIFPFYVVIKTYDGTNNNELLNEVRFNYERETERDSAYNEITTAYTSTLVHLGGTTFQDTSQNTLIIIDWE